jgi:DNA-binding MarR family transcriptional regulator
VKSKAVSSPKTERAKLVQTLATEVGRTLSTHTVMLHAAVAERLGLNITDHKALDFACRGGGTVTAGELAELTGLTTGAITGVIDRLEKAGFARRERDPNDRRRIIIRPIPSRAREIGRLFESLAQSMTKLCSQYTDRDLALLIDFFDQVTSLVQEETQKLRTAQ